MIIINWISTHKRITLVVIAGISLLAFGSFFLFQNIKHRFFSNNDMQPAQAINPSPLTPGSANIKLTSPETSLNMNETFDFKIIASSSLTPVSGFDVVIEFDPEFFSLAEKQSEKLSEFNYFAKTYGNTIRISGVQKENSTTNQVFNETELFNLVFQPKKTGKTQFKMIYSPNSTSDSNLITLEGKDILGTAQGLEVEIK